MRFSVRFDFVAISFCFRYPTCRQYDSVRVNAALHHAYLVVINLADVHMN